MKIFNSNSIKEIELLNAKKGVPSMQGTSKEDFGYINKLIEKLENAQNGQDASKVLFSAADDGEIEDKGDILFKAGSYYINHMLKFYGVPYVNTLERLEKTGVSVTPKVIKTITKNNNMFLVTKIEGSETGDLIPLNEARDKVSKESLLEAYKDLQKITKAGIVDNAILRSPDLWFVTPDNYKIVLPQWSQTRPLQPAEGKSVLERYYNILFRQ